MYIGEVVFKGHVPQINSLGLYNILSDPRGYGSGETKFHDFVHPNVSRDSKSLIEVAQNRGKNVQRLRLISLITISILDIL